MCCRYSIEAQSVAPCAGASISGSPWPPIPCRAGLKVATAVLEPRFMPHLQGQVREWDHSGVGLFLSGHSGGMS